MHPWVVRAEGEVVVPFPSERVEAWTRFDTFFEEEHERLFKALYFVTGNRHDAEELMQDAFLRLWERWDEIHRIKDPTGYLFRVALNGFRMRRLRAAMFIREGGPGPGAPRCVPRYGDARGRAAAPARGHPAAGRPPAR